MILIFFNYLNLNLAEFLALKDFSKLTTYLKDKDNSIVLAQLTRYHFSILVILHKLNDLYNQENLNTHIREILELS